jgi:hypothetical protein
METSARGGLTTGVFLVLALLSDFMERESLNVRFNSLTRLRYDEDLRVLLLLEGRPLSYAGSFWSGHCCECGGSVECY